ncbi:MAG: T9SS type A sorting domain-containing protein, partial [candidate division Zixibacteria bacterium]
AGHPDILDSLLDCSWGLGTILSDMGAYGGGDSVTVGIDYPDIPSPEKFSISQNYPNPFNAMTVIRYSLPEPSDVIIEIYDILGRKVETLVNEKQPVGYHQEIWDATVRSSGIYFYRIQAGDHSETRKMVLIK